MMLDQSIKAGELLVEQEHFASDDIQEKIKDVEQQWKNLEDLAKARRKRLGEASDIYQVIENNIER